MADSGGNDRLAALTQRFERELPARLRALADSCSALAVDAQRVGGVDALANEVHRLAGTCGLFGYAALADELATVETSLRDAGRRGDIDSAGCNAVAEVMLGLTTTWRKPDANA